MVDNGSRDRTAEAARTAGATVVSEPRRGYGHACLAGIAAAGDADVFVFLDGDHSDYPAQLVDVVAPILEGRADLVIGSRNRGRREAGAHPWHAVLGTRACVGLMNLLSGSKATDLGPVPRDHRGRAPPARHAGPELRLDGRDAGEGRSPGAAGGRGAGRLPPAHRPEQGQRNRARYDRRRHEDHRDHPAPRFHPVPSVSPEGSATADPVACRRPSDDSAGSWPPASCSRRACSRGHSGRCPRSGSARTWRCSGRPSPPTSWPSPLRAGCRAAGWRSAWAWPFSGGPCSWPRRPS